MQHHTEKGAAPNKAIIFSPVKSPFALQVSFISALYKQVVHKIISFVSRFFISKIEADVIKLFKGSGKCTFVDIWFFVCLTFAFIYSGM